MVTDPSWLPTVGDGARLGTGAKVLGSIRIGAKARIGANAVVLNDVPDAGVAVGVAARVVGIARDEKSNEANSALRTPSDSAGLRLSARHMSRTGFHRTEVILPCRPRLIT